MRGGGGGGWGFFFFQAEDGIRDYDVTGVQTCALPIFNWDFAFYDSYMPCDLPSAPGNCVNLAGALPTVALPAGGFCWVGTLDLSLGGYEICMEADGGSCAAGYDGGGLGLDAFGWGDRKSNV